MIEIVQKAELAERLGVSRARVSQLVKAGLPVRPDGKVEFAAAVEWINSRVRRDPAVADAAGDDVADVRLRLLLSQVRRNLIEADRAQVALDSERGKLIDKDKARRTVIAWNIKIKKGLLDFASRRGPALAVELGVNEVALVGGIEAAMREHLAEMADEPLPIVEASR